MSEVKMVIVMRKDLKMRRGKEIAQGAHAASAWLLDRLEFKDWNQGDAPEGRSWYEVTLTDEEERWMHSGTTKVCVKVDSEAELAARFAAARLAGLTCHMITDAGRTEFNGVPTVTCIAIGPNDSDEIDKITGDLTLY